MPTVEPKELKNILSNWPAWVKEQRDAIGQEKEESDKKTDSYDHPLLRSWQRKRDDSGKYPMSSWSNPVTASADEKLVSPDTTDVQPVYMAIVDADDPRAVLDVISLVPASTVSNSPMVYTREKGKWTRDPKTLADLNSPTPPPVVPLDDETLNDVLQQMDESQGITASIALIVLYGNEPIVSSIKENISTVLRKYWIAGPGAKKIQWGVGGDWYRCVRQLAPFLGVRAKGYCQMLHKTALGYYTSTHARMERAKLGQFESDEEFVLEFTEVTESDMRTPLKDIIAQQEDEDVEDFEIDEDIKVLLSDIEALDYEEYSLVAAGGADRNRGGAENLRRYWKFGKGALKIRWGTPGDWTRCVRQLRKYMGPRAKGYCALRHKEMTGMWPGDKKNRKKFSFDDTYILKGEEQLISDSFFSALSDTSLEEIILASAHYEIGDLGYSPDGEKEVFITEDGETCPPSTQDVALNLENRQKAIDNVGYGPLNPAQPNDVFWQDKAERWNTTVRDAKSAVCGNCVFFVRTPDMLNCIETGIGLDQEAEGSVEAGELGYCNALDFKCASERTCNAWATGGPVTSTAGSKPSPRKEQITGSKKNKPGSAKSGAGVTFTAAIEKALEGKVKKHNEDASDGRKTSIRTLKAVYRRGAGAFSTSHRPDQNRNSWAMARVNAFLHLLKTGTPKNKKYITDNDLLPASHPKSAKSSSSALNASAHLGGGGSSFRIPLVIPEEVESGDGRKFNKGAIELRELPLPLLWQIQTGNGHDGSVVVGRIDSMERTEDGIGNAYGVFDSGSYGSEAERLVRGGFLSGVSADMDKFEATEEVVTEASDDDEDKKIKKEKIIINSARVMAVTIVPKPAFQECKIFLDEPEDEPQEDNMIPDGIYIEDIEPTEAEAVVASGLIAGSIPVAPPKSWFTNPQLKQPTPLTVTDEGRVYGHIAAWDVDHIGMVSGTRPPRSRSNYSYFHTGLLRTEEGADVPVGQITLAGGHADIRASASEAVKHYDDTASAVIDAHAGEDAYGIWVAGSLRPGVTPEQVRALRASAPSGDWRPIRGSLELVAVCQVNVPGFPIARAMVSSGQVTALIAAGASMLAKMRYNPMQELDERLSKLEKKEKAGLIAAAQEARAKFQSLRPFQDAPVSEEPVVSDGFYQEVEPRLVPVLEKTLADVVAFSFIAQGYHWNVKGANFPQYHDFFGEIYEDVRESIDPLGENILKLGYDAPFNIAQFAQMSELSASGTKDSSCEAMSYDLYVANMKVIDCYKEAFAVADSMNEQGIADFVSGRIDMHQKWAWQLKASSMPEKMRKENYEDAPEPMDMMLEYVDEVPEVAILSSGAEQSFDVFSALTELAKFTKEEREELAKEGKALPDGSYPIRNEEDLKNAIATYGLGKSPKEEIRAHIIKRAKELDKEDMIPENWTEKKNFSVEEMRERISQLSATLEV
jgi:DNA-binding ferritin-like protein